MRNLIIHRKWLNLILSGEKTWEIRSRNTSIRGQIGLGYRKYRHGIASLVDVKKMTLEELERDFDKHKVTPKELEKYLHGKNYGYAYILKDVKKVDPPVPIPPSYGNWVYDK